MSLEDSVLASARACEGAAVALSHSLRSPANAPGAPANVIDTYREAEAFAITVRAVLEEAAPLLPLLAADSRCVGRRPGLVYPGGRVNNGFDTIAVVLVALFDTAVDAILDVAGNQHRWLVSPLQASATFEKMVGHHGQLRAMYGIVHLAAKIVSHADMENTLFVDVSGVGSHPELEPAKWRAAIKMDDFYGRHFGFHYAPEMRNVLRAVNIARGSVHKSHHADDETSPLIKNMTMLGWGWVYSNMVLMNSFGLNIDGVSQIGADNTRGGMSIQALRKFMNLVEEPLVAGVSGLAGVDIAIDKVFEIPTPGQTEGLEAPDSPVHSERLRAILATVTDPVHGRLMSFKHRPIDLPQRRRHKAPQKRHPSDPLTANAAAQSLQKNSESLRPQGIEVAADHSVMQTHDSGGTGTVVTQIGRSSEADLATDFFGVSTLPSLGGTGGGSESGAEGAEIPQTERRQGAAVSPAVPVEIPVVHTIDAKEPQNVGNDSTGKRSAKDGNGSLLQPSSQMNPSLTKRRTNILTEGLKGAAESSYLATTIKTELSRLQTNVSMFLGIEEVKAASALILHFHGGGFVSQSSESHAIYLKEWCTDIPDAVLLSIDYKLAPENRFPTAVHECVYAYVWALQNAARLGTRCEQVVFAGDSAGGNLAVATALLVQELGLRGPDGVCVAYPALYVNIAWSPSRLLSFFDPLLPLSVLELCVKSYLPDGEEQKGQECPLLSPVVASSEALRELPPVTMVCGSLDPLLDDSVLFAHRLRKAGRKKDVMRVYEAMPHGFLNMQQVNLTARSAMRFMAKTMAEYLEVPLRPGSKAAQVEMEEGTLASATARASAVFDA